MPVAFPSPGGLSAALALVVVLLSGPVFAQQNLGHRVLGALGLDAGVQPEPGIYIADRLLSYRSDTLIDREGSALAVGLDLSVLANVIGVAAVFDLGGTYLTSAVAVPVASVSVATRRPEASIDRFGLADLYLQPIRLGWRLPRFDAVTSYAVYAPTSRLAPGGAGDVGRTQWAHEFAAGGSVYFAARSWRFTALASYILNMRKVDVDITRGDTVQVQGGVGGRVYGPLEAGFAAYALWQVRDDRGSALPPVLAGARERTFGVGPELGLTVPAIRSRFTLRYEHDFGVRARPEGGILLFGVAFAAWRPEAGEPAQRLDASETVKVLERTLFHASKGVPVPSPTLLDASKGEAAGAGVHQVVKIGVPARAGTPK